MKILVSILISLFAGIANAQDYNLTFGPFGLLMGAPNARFDMQVNDQWVFGPEVGYFQMDIGDFNVRASELRVTAGFYPNGNFKDGYFAAPFVAYRSVKVKSNVDNASASLSLMGAVGGFHWFWDSFNIRAGAGVNAGLGNGKIKVWNNAGETESVNTVPNLTIDIAFGFTF